MRLITIFILLIFCLGFLSIKKNNPIPHELWKQLSPYCKKCDDENSEKDLRSLLKSKEKRSEISDFILNKMSSIYLSHEDQMRLGFIVTNIKLVATHEEYKIINKIISESKKHNDLYGFILDVEPPYILESMNVLKIKKRLRAKIFNPDGGKFKYIIQDKFLDELKRVSQLDYGDDYNSWAKWWLTTGQYLHYDKEKKKYIKKESMGSS